MENPGKENQIQKILDSAKTKAFLRGARTPGWKDVWLSVAENHEFSRVLAERGVMVGGFHRDLDYATKFGLKNGSIEQSSITKDHVFQVCDELRKKIDQKIIDCESNRHGGVDSPSEDVRRRAEKDDLSKEIMQEMLNSLLNLERTAGDDGMHQHALIFVLGYIADKFSKDNDLEPSAGQHSFDPEILMHIRDLLDDPVLIYEDQRAVFILEQLNGGNPFKRPSALEVIDQLLASSPEFYKDLMYRNGMLTNNAYMEDELLDSFPHREVQKIALEALDCAYSVGSREVDARHVVTTMMANAELQMHLHDLGVKDLMEFRDNYTDKVFEQENEDESTIRVHPRVTRMFKDLLDDLDQFANDNKKDDHLISKMFREIFKADPQVDKDLNKAGLRRRMSRGWMKPYQEDGRKVKDEDDEKDKKKKDKPFEIGDEQLEDLIAEYCVDYTKLAAQKKFDPMIGNEGAMEEVETTLLKRGKKNPIVIGEPGIGKTKILEGFAQRIVSGKVPKKLIGSRLLSLDLHSINTSPYVGVFESRILPILKGVAERNASGRFPPVQIAIDEFGNAMDAGAHSKGEGIKGMIKPYLTGGDLFVIATTTMDEYQQKVQKDGALARRFNPVMMRPPTEQEAAEILMQLKPRYSKHHGIRVPNKLVAVAANLAERYIHQVNHPDKSLDLFDLACAMAVKAGDRTLEEKHLVKATSSMSGVPEDFLNKEDKKRYVDLPDNLNELVLDQKDAVAKVSAALQRAKAGLRSNPEAPIGTFLFVGPTGVGKTELTRALTRLLYGNEDFLIRKDMSEYMEQHSVSRLIGAPPGYVGFEEGGGLVNEVRQKPYSVILFDEIEKAHPDVYNALLRPFDSGMLTDGRGVDANMRNTINIMTSNLGAAEVMKRGKELGLDPLKDREEWQRMAQPIYKEAVEKFFKPEFLNRLDGVIYFDSLSEETIGLLVDRQIEQAREQVRENHFGLDFTLSDKFRDAVAAQGFDVRFGARPLKRAWQDMVTTPMATWLLSQDDRALKRAGTLVVEASAQSSEDAEAIYAEVLDGASEGENLTQRLREAQNRIEAVRVIVPTFKLQK